MSVEYLEKAIYACLAQADLAIEEMDAHLTVEQLVATKEGDAKAKAEAANKAAEAKPEDAVAPTAPKQLADAPVVSAEVAESPACDVKRPPGDTSAPQSKRSWRRRPAIPGSRDG